jgi:putative hydrolase of the HAD superfamily
MNIKAAIFDIGGVLAHDVWENLLLDEKCGIASKYSLCKDKTERVGKLLWQLFAYQTEFQDHEWRELEMRYWELFIQYFTDQLKEPVPDNFIELTDSFIRPVEGMIPLLEKLQSQGIDLAICSNNNEFWFRRQMDKLGLYRFFKPSKIILSCRIGVPKSSPKYEMLKAAVDALGVSVADCIFVDDRKRNVERAQDYGMTAFHFKDVRELDYLIEEEERRRAATVMSTV